MTTSTASRTCTHTDLGDRRTGRPAVTCTAEATAFDGPFAVCAAHARRQDDVEQQTAVRTITAEVIAAPAIVLARPAAKPAAIHQGGSASAPCGADLRNGAAVYECDDFELCDVCLVLVGPLTSWVRA
ncbi:hypothetical protein GCM10023340_39060 [Nocardioides marinquilinus]|uniref:Uncharacterized protein n=1 Tax=Nocardioides marinquilinus TaxID=1210400 RepID=A0ABP9Q065_9ACTN